MPKLFALMLFGFAMLLPAVQPAMAAPAASEGASSEMIMQQFSGDDEISPERKITTERKHQILFMMGIALLVLLLVTGSLGVAMVGFGQDVFLAHMIFAGLSMTLAVVHAATSIAWFWPY